MGSRKLLVTGLALGTVGIALVLLVHGLVFFWVPTERTMGVVQRIFYIHVPSAWVAFMAFGIVALCSAVYLWIEDERVDAAAVSAAEGGMYFTTIVLLTGPLWGKIAWGAWWVWEPRLTLTLLLWFIYLGYFLVRTSTENPQKGKKFAAVVGVVGVLDIPLIHLSVVWFRSQHPGAVVLKPDAPTLHPDMLTTLFIGVGGFTALFFSLFLFRYRLQRLRHERAVRRSARGTVTQPRGVTS